MSKAAKTTLCSAILCLSFGAAHPGWADETIVLRSGQAPIGSPDPLVTRLDCPACNNSFFPNPFTPADFAAAVSGEHATVINRNNLWIQQLLDPAAKWINNTGDQATGGTALYAVPFHLSQAGCAAMLELRYAVDNFLGEKPALGGPCTSTNTRAGIYINGFPVSGSNGIGGFMSEFTGTFDIGPLLVAGDNVLYLYDYDCGSAAGIMFSAVIRTSCVTPVIPRSWGTLKVHYR